MKVITPGKLHWSIRRTCQNIKCQAELEVGEKDFLQEDMGMSFQCPECRTINLLDAATASTMPGWVYQEAAWRRSQGCQGGTLD